jgi:hypothetical protein
MRISGLTLCFSAGEARGSGGDSGKLESMPFQGGVAACCQMGNGS